MSFSVLIANRSIKLFANLTKMLYYPVHYLFPKRRFTLPEHAKPWRPSKQTSTIPRIVWQTNFTNRVSFPVYLNYLFNRLMSLDHAYRFVDDDAQHAFMHTQMPPQVARAYDKLLDGAAKADMWRAAVLYKHGGTYIDIDGHLVWPLSKLIRPDDTELVIFNRKDYTNYFMAFNPGNPIIGETLDRIVENISHYDANKNVYALTGPKTLNDALEGKTFNFKVFRYACVQGSFTNEYFQYIDRPGSKWTHKKPDEIMKG